MIKKLISGRFLLTVISGLVFAYATYAKLLDSQAVSAVLSLVFVSYFNKKENGEHNGN